MAIGNNPGGGSAATRFRPRGTAPVAGLGRRSLLADDSDGAAADDGQEAAEVTQEDSVSTPQPTSSVQVQPRPPYRRQVSEFPAADGQHQPEALTGSLESQSAATDRSAPIDSPTSTDPSPSSTTPTSSPRGRGRPRLGSTPSAGSRSYQSPDATAAPSVSDARARMREIEQQVKQLRSEHAAELDAVNRAFRERAQPLQAEHQELSRLITDVTFGF